MSTVACRAVPQILIYAMAIATNACARDAAAPVDLTSADRAAIATNDSAYVTAWLRDDTTAVMAAFEAQPVLIPGGLAPLVGRDAAHAFWWPTDGTHTKVTYFGRSIDEIGGSGSVGFIRGTDSLRFIYAAKDGKSSEQGLRSTTLAVVRRQPDGRWQIARMSWATVTR